MQPRTRYRLGACAVLVIIVATLVARRLGYKVGGNTPVRSRDGHVYTTLWIPGASVKSIRLGWLRCQWCPVGRHWSLASPVRPAALTRRSACRPTSSTTCASPEPAPRPARPGAGRARGASVGWPMSDVVPQPAPSTRASDADRDRVLQVLATATADGRLTVDEHSDLMTQRCTRGRSASSPSHPGPRHAPRGGARAVAVPASPRPSGASSRSSGHGPARVAGTSRRAPRDGDLRRRRARLPRRQFETPEVALRRELRLRRRRDHRAGLGPGHRRRDRHLRRARGGRPVRRGAHRHAPDEGDQRVRGHRGQAPCVEAAAGGGPTLPEAPPA